MSRCALWSQEAYLIRHWFLFIMLRHRCSLIAMLITSSKQDLAEGWPKVWVKDGIDDRVEKTVDVAKPDNDACQYVWIPGQAIAAEWLYESHDEEWKPTDNERPGHNRQCSGRFPLPLLFLFLASQRRRRQQWHLLVVRGRRSQQRFKVASRWAVSGFVGQRSWTGRREWRLGDGEGRTQSVDCRGVTLGGCCQRHTRTISK